MTVASHTLSAADFEALSSGRGDAATIAALRAGQLSKHILQIRAVLDAAPAAGPRTSWLFRAYDLLSSVQRTHPRAVESILLHPYVGAWGVRCLNRLYGLDVAEGVLDGGSELDVELGYLAGIAASAAIQAGLAFEISVPIRDGGILLPGLGAATVPSGSCAEATLRSDGSVTQVLTASGCPIVVPVEPGRNAPGWTSLRRLHAHCGDLEITVELDDLDYYRSSVYPDVTGRLTDREAQEWRRVFELGWSLLVRDHRRYAHALAAGLKSVVAQISAEPGQSISATSTDAFGSIAMSRPPDAATLAVTLIHEFQHVKLSALLDLMPMYEIRTGTRYYAPWRDDPRPIGGLLQGAYAFLGVTDFWRAHQHSGEAAHTDLAGFEFARWREQTGRAVTELAGSPELTDAGRLLIEGLRATLQAWAGETVPDEIAAQASDSAIDHRARWRMRNLRPAAPIIAGLADRWRCDEPAGAVPDSAEVTSGASPARSETASFRLWHLRMTDPSRFDAICRGEGQGEEWRETSEADIAYARRDYAQAARGYREMIALDPESVQAWVGLALASRHNGDVLTSAALLSRPEVLLALYSMLRRDADAPDPAALACWLHGISPDSAGEARNE
jgi:HEXXH motif-containing protein